MPFPDDLPSDWDQWFNDLRIVSPRLGALLGRGANRFATLTAVARHLGLDLDHIGDEGFYVLDRIVAPLEEVLTEDPGHWITDYLASRGDWVARSAVEDISSLDALHGALVQFGWQKAVLGRSPQVRNLVPELRDALIKKLARLVYKMLDDWRLRDAWNPEHGKMPTGLVSADSRNLKKPPKAPDEID